MTRTPKHVSLSAIFGGRRACFDWRPGIPQNGLEAVEFAPSFQPDVVSLDIGMPKLNGHELPPHMRAQA